MPFVYSELRRLAHLHLRRERTGHTIQTTALVHEAYLRLVDQNKVNWQNRAHFLAVAAKLMRRILIDYARSRRSAKRQGEMEKVSLDEAATAACESADDLIALDDALLGLQTIDPRKGQVVELRYFGGLSIEETACILKVSHATIERDWATAQVWLYRELANK